MSRRLLHQPGFTLVELLVVIAIIGILMSMMLPAVSAVRESGHRAQCQNNLRQFGVALTDYHTIHGAFPIGNFAPNWPYSLAGGWWGFQARLLPHLEANDVYEMCNFSYQSDCFDWIGQQPPQMNPGVLVLPCNKCPDDPLVTAVYDTGAQGKYSCGNFLGVMGTTEFANDGILLHGGPSSAISLNQVTDGASHTLIMGERGISDNLYGWPYCGAGDQFNTGCGDNLMSTQNGLSVGSAAGTDDYHFWSYHPNLSHFLWADGSAQSLTYDIDYSILQALATRAGGEAVQTP
jgi:prepilin-type N-terminal cleavage/methylation domain-containing protein/prepilin-type processing-associated H-X9-DG protein